MCPRLSVYFLDLIVFCILRFGLTLGVSALQMLFYITWCVQSLNSKHKQLQQSTISQYQYVHFTHPKRTKRIPSQWSTRQLPKLHNKVSLSRCSSFYFYPCSLTLSLPCLPRCHSKNDQRKCQIWNQSSIFVPFVWARKRISTKMRSIESRFVIGPPNTLFAGVYVCTFQPGNFTGWGSEGVNSSFHRSSPLLQRSF